MTATPITLDATLKPDGVTLQLEQKLSLPPGRVVVTVQPTASKAGPTMLEVLDRIHTDQRQRGHRPMTEEEMAVEMARMRTDDDEYEQRCREIWAQTGTRVEKTDNR